ncbi:MAG: histidine kinase [Oscillospiraceae bacterium]|nr:histidine kinase [Oscillospiraceae bacterium]
MLQYDQEAGKGRDAVHRLTDKLLLLGLCLLILSFSRIALIYIVALLTAVAASSLCEYFDNSLPPYLCAAYLILCLFIPGFAAFLPLIVYDCAGFGKLYARYCWVVALPVGFAMSDPQNAVAVMLLSGVALLLHYRTQEQIRTREDFFALTDSAKEQSISLERKNRELMEKQDYEVRLATLRERNRIAREIHDNVGHLLTRSILQISALHVTHPDDGELQGELSSIKDTMSGAMDSVRSSIHDLHDESVDLRMQLESMISGFNFCPVKLRFDAGNLPGAIKYCFVAVAREALSNIARHSGATEAIIVVAEHPAFCRLSVEDNGSVKSPGDSGGIGLRNMADRVDALGGVFRAENNKGFKIFLSIPKENIAHDKGHRY